MYKTQGIILKRTDVREADRIYAAYTEDCGKVAVLAKGAAKIKSKMAGHLEPLSLARICVAPGQSANHLAGASLARDWPRLRGSWEKLSVAGRGLDAVDRLTRWEQPGPEIFGLLSSFLEKLEAAEEGRNHAFLLAAFVVKLMALLGYAPELRQCVFCKKKMAPAKIFFSVHQGGLICQFCSGRKNAPAKPVSPAAVKVLRLFLEKSSSFNGRAKTNGKVLEEIIALAGEYLDYYLDRPAELKA